MIRIFLFVNTVFIFGHPQPDNFENLKRQSALFT